MGDGTGLGAHSGVVASGACTSYQLSPGVKSDVGNVDWKEALASCPFHLDRLSSQSL